MKINIVIEGNNQQKQIIDLDEYNDIVWDIKSKLDNIFNEKGKFTKKYLNVLYKGLILDDYKSIIFYKIIENDEICIGQLETFLGSELIVVEMFMIGSFAELIYLTVKRTDLLSEFESILKRLFPDLNGLQIWSRKGIPLQSNQRMIDIDQHEEYFKVLIEISYNNHSQFKSFEECCKIHDRDILSGYGWIDDFDDKPSNKLLNSPVKQMISEIKLDDEYHFLLNQDLSNVLISLRHSKFFFCMNIGGRILDIYTEVFDPVMIQYRIRKNSEVYTEFILHFPIAIHLALINYIDKCEINGRYVRKSIRNIVLEALNQFLTILKDSFKGYRDLMKSFLDKFLYFPIIDSEVNMNVSEEKKFNEYFYVKIKESLYRISFPKESQTNFQAKSKVSLQTGIPMQQLYFIELGNNEPPVENECFDLKKVNNKYSYDIIYEMDNVQINEKLGEGSFGQVFRCCDKNNSKEFVLKEPFNQSSLHQDIMIQSRLSQIGNMLKYDRLINCNGQICIAIKYMKKGSLRSILNIEKYLSENEAIRISYQLLVQIVELHQLGIIHRDIKSDNIVLDEGGNAKLVDFGLSRYMEKWKALKNVNGSGTILYMAPELFNDETYTNLIDIWSLGIVAIEMITGNPPYYRLGEGPAILAISEKKKIRYKSPQPISIEFTEFIESCLEPDSMKRLQAEQLIKFPIFKSHLVI